MTLDMGGFAVGSSIRRGPVTLTVRVAHREGGAEGVGKRLVPRFRDDPVARAALDTEGRVLAALEGRGAPRLLGRGEDAAGPWLVMEAIAGVSLAEAAWPHEARRNEGLRLVRPAFAALAAVHGAADTRGPLDVVHGDVSPDNLVMCDAPSGGDLIASARAVTLVDFGLASFRDAPCVASSAFRGTIGFVAPEIARGQPPSRAGDVFSLALTLLYAATGDMPRPDAPLAAALLHAGTEPVDAYVETATRGFPDGLARFLARATSSDASLRPEAAEALTLAPW